MFGSLKANAQLFEASRLLKDENGKIKPFQTLKNDFNKLNIAYNQNYLEAEYQFAVQSALSANQWDNFSDNEERYYLQYRTAKDEKVRASHRELADITLPKNDPFWDQYSPPNGWRCRCKTTEVLARKYPKSNSTDAIAKGKKATTQISKSGKNHLEIFRFNPGKTEKLMPPNHPYNKVEGAKEVSKEVSKQKRKEKDAEIKKWAKNNISENGIILKAKNIKTGELHISRSSIKSIGDHFTDEQLKEIAKHIITNLKKYQYIESAPLNPESHNYDKKLRHGVTKFHYYTFEWNNQKFKLNTEEINGKYEKPYAVNLIVKK